MREKVTGKIRVLVIEDDLDDFHLVRNLLSVGDAEEYQLDRAGAFEGGLEELTQGNHDVYLLASSLRKQSGLDLLRETRKEDDLPPVLMLTDGDPASIGVEALELGAHGYLEKSEMSSRSLGQAIRYAIRRHREYKRLRKQVIEDELTGLLNRRGIRRVVADEFARCRRYGTEFSLLLVDLDNFKRINDTYGHLIGDKVLREVANRIVSTVREVDKVGRYGGDELLIILPQTSVRQAGHAAKRILARIHDEPYRVASDDEGQINVSLTATIGATGVPPDNADLDNLLRRADSALYRAKKSGKNQVTLSQE